MEKRSSLLVKIISDSEKSYGSDHSYKVKAFKYEHEIDGSYPSLFEAKNFLYNKINSTKQSEQEGHQL